MYKTIKKLKFVIFVVFLFVLALILNPITVEKTIPEDVKISEILVFAINVKDRTINVHLENGLGGTVNQATFLNFWNNTMNANQRTIVKGFVKQLSALAMTVAEEKVTGDLMD